MQTAVLEKRQTGTLFDLNGRIAVITGGAGLLGEQHACAIAGAGGIPVLLDISGARAKRIAESLRDIFDVPALGLQTDITSREALAACLETVLERFGSVDILINNAANNPKMESREDVNFSRFENFPLEQWNAD